MEIRARHTCISPIHFQGLKSNFHEVHVYVGHLSGEDSSTSLNQIEEFLALVCNFLMSIQRVHTRNTTTCTCTHSSTSFNQIEEFLVVCNFQMSVQQLHTRNTTIYIYICINIFCWNL